MTKHLTGKILIIGLLLIIALTGSSLSFGQQSSEQFIPIGQSPGISSKLSYIGSIKEVNRAANTLVVDSNRGIKTVAVTPSTRFWLDRSASGQSNLVANFEDCKVGLKVEIKHENKDAGVADWIKISPI